MFNDADFIEKIRWDCNNVSMHGSVVCKCAHKMGGRFEMYCAEEQEEEEAFVVVAIAGCSRCIRR